MEKRYRNKIIIIIIINETNKSLLACSLLGKFCTKHMTNRKVILWTLVSTKRKERNNRVSRHSMH